MKYFVVLALATVASAARLENVYLPPNARSSSGINAGLQAPKGGFQGAPQGGGWLRQMFVVLALATVASAACLENVYLPPNARFSSGISAGLQAPKGGFQGAPQGGGFNGQAQSYSSASASASASSQAQILRFDNEINEDGFHYAYETSDGTKAEQEGRVIPGAKPEEGSLQVSGSYSYVGDDGQTYSVTYTADENGYQAKGDHLPTPPPIPEAILKSLQLTAGNGAHYESQRSSYDADKTGY